MPPVRFAPTLWLARCASQGPMAGYHVTARGNERKVIDRDDQGDRHEQTELRRLAPRLSWEQIVAKVEQARGQCWNDFLSKLRRLGTGCRVMARPQTRALDFAGAWPIMRRNELPDGGPSRVTLC